jgi:phosphopantothenoylcysteine decarboxylase / phosphopantothenate---cysteine ligase
MNDRMYAHPQTQQNLLRLQEIGYGIAGPAVGPLAWGEGEGPGRLLEPGEILAHAARALEATSLFTGLSILVSAGPTREPIDPIRFVGNRSSGRMGFALAEAAWRRGADVTLVTGPTSLADPPGVRVRRVETAGEMEEAIGSVLPSARALVMAAAVADFRPSSPFGQKVKKESEALLRIELTRTPDILQSTRSLRPDGCVVVGFALETEDALTNALRKLEAKGLDLLVVNDATEPGAGFEHSTNRVTLLRPGAPSEELPLLTKSEVAERILDAMVPLLERAESES